MKAVEKTYNHGFRSHWVRIEKLSDEILSWEWDTDEDNDEEDYISGDIVIEGKTCVDYDGCYELPSDVLVLLDELGFDITEIDTRDEK